LHCKPTYLTKAAPWYPAQDVSEGSAVRLSCSHGWWPNQPGIPQVSLEICIYILYRYILYIYIVYIII
jgi:hypothetical protein